MIAIMLGGSVDLFLDRPSSWWSVHVLFEAGMVALSLAFAIYLFREWRRTTGALVVAEQSLALARRTEAERARERDEWKQRAEGALTRLSTAIDQQFTSWRLSPAEREVALLLLKGEGHKQAAARLGRSERTVRQQAVEVYRKAGLQGRAELAAFFLNDLELPPPPT